jgi:hypothetical protein
LDATWDKAERLLDACATYGIQPQSVLEIGAGRDLALPLALRCMGVPTVCAADVERLACLDLVRNAGAHMARRAGAWFECPKTWEALEQGGVLYRAPVAADQIFGPHDCTCSHEVLEHVPADDLPRLLAALRAATRPGGLSIHSIDYSDHFARCDPSLTRLHFLRYSDDAWAPYNSRFQYVNRLRHSDYVALFKAAGFQTVCDERCRSAPLPPAVDRRFSAYSAPDLCTTSGYIVARA